MDMCLHLIHGMTLIVNSMKDSGTYAYSGISKR